MDRMPIEPRSIPDTDNHKEPKMAEDDTDGAPDSLAPRKGAKLGAGPKADGRSARAVRYRTLFKAFMADMSAGGVTLTQAQIQLCKRSATLSAMLEAMEQQIQAGKEIDPELFGRATDRLGRCLQRISPDLDGGEGRSTINNNASITKIVRVILNPDGSTYDAGIVDITPAAVPEAIPPEHAPSLPPALPVLDAGSANETARACMGQRGYTLVQKDQAEEVRAAYATAAQRANPPSR
jgi:hypothetical protein